MKLNNERPRMENCRQSRQAITSAFMHKSGSKVIWSQNCSSSHLRPYPPMYRHDDLGNPAFRHHLKNQRGSLNPNHRFRILGMRDNTQRYCSPSPFRVTPKVILAPWIHPCLRLVSACPELVLESHGTTATEKRLHVYQYMAILSLT